MVERMVIKMSPNRGSSYHAILDFLDHAILDFSFSHAFEGKKKEEKGKDRVFTFKFIGQLKPRL